MITMTAMNKNPNMERAKTMSSYPQTRAMRAAIQDAISTPTTIEMIVTMSSS